MRDRLRLLYKISTLILFVVACAFKVSAQSYPVQVNVALTPPYSAFLTDYVAPGAQKFTATFLLRDLNVTDYKGKLRLTIEGVGITIRTKANYVPLSPITLYGGESLTLFGEDLEEYFNPNNLDFAGISRSQYEKGAKLPEGVYRFTLEMLDYNRSTLVSNKGTAVAWVILNDPPLLNLPRNDSKAKIIDPTNIAFTWTPRHTGSPNSAFTTEYIFKLVEIWPATRNPYDAFLSQQPLYEITTSSTQIIYGPAEPALIPGRKYAWQVQAKDIEDRDLFKNQGKSEVYVFQFGDALGIPENLSLQKANPSSLIVRWEQPVAGTDAVAYTVRYRPHGKRNHDNWYTEKTSDQWRAIPQLQPNTEYEVQVRAEQGAQASDYGAVKIFKTAIAGANDFVCKSDVSPPAVPANAIPATRLGINDTIYAAGYEVLVRELTANEGGTYTGSGMMIVPWFQSAKVRMTFKNIRVNEQHWLTAGEIKSVWNADSKFLVKSEKKVDSTNAPLNGELPVNIVATETLIEITGAAIATVTKDEEGNIEVYTTDGDKKVLPKGKSYSIADEVGNGYVVDEKGNITKTTAEEARNAAGRGDRNYTIALTFSKGNGKYGFDEKKYEALSSYYQQLEGGQYIPWKAVTASQPDAVAATLEGTDIAADKVRFEINGSKVPATNNGNNYTLNVRGGAGGMVEELLALYTPTDTSKDNVLGKLNLVSYDQLTRNLVIVPVNGAAIPGGLSANILSQKLTEIYGQAVAAWDVKLEPSINVSLDDTFDDGESGLLTNYTGDMKKVIKAYGNLQDKTYYIFLVSKPRSGVTLGYMPRSRQAGFIFVDKLNNTNVVNTLAHEIGHGAFNLQHTFKEYPSLAQGSTDNLMDYPNGPALYKYQWDNIHEPQKVLGLFEDDEDSQSQAISQAPAELVSEDGRTITFMSPAGTLVVLSSFAKKLTFAYGFNDSDHDYIVPGTLLSFEVKGKQYSLSGTTKDGPFSGYSNDEGKRYNPSDFFEEDIIAKGKSTAILMLPCAEKVSFVKFAVSGIPLEKGEISSYKSTADFPLKPFSSQNTKLKEKVYALTDKPDLFDFADHRQELTQSVFDFLKGDCEQEYLLLKLKASEYYSLNPAIFSKFYSTVISATTGDLKNLQDLRTQNKNTEFWSKYIDAYKAHLQQSQQTLSAKLSSLTLSISASDWEDLSLLMGPGDYENLTFEQRLLLLKIATKFISIGNGDKWIRTLIVSTPDEQQKKLLDALVVEKDAAAERFLLPRLLNDFKGADGQEFIELTSKLVEWIFTYYPVSGNFNYNAALANGKYISFEPGFWTGDFVTEYFNEQGDVVLKTNFGNGRTLQARPFEYIVIESHSDYTIAGVQLAEGAKLKMPALYAYMVFNNLNTQRLYKTGRLAFDVAMLSIGVGELNAAIEVGNAFRLTRSLADIGMGLSDITFSHILDQSLMQSEAGKSFLDTWGNIMMAYGVLRIGDEFFNAQMMRMEKSISDMSAEGKLTKAELKEIENAKDALKEKLNLDNITKVKLADRLDDYPAIKKKIESFTDVLQKQKFLDDFDDASSDVLVNLNADNAKLVGTWKVLDDTGIDAVLRKDPTTLQKVSNYVALKPSRAEEFLTYLKTEIKKGREKLYLKSLLDRKEYSGTVYRGDKASLTPEQVFKNGFSSPGSHDNLLNHIESNTTRGDFVSTTRDPSIADAFSSKNGYVYEIRSKKGIDVNATLGGDADTFFPEQVEVSIPGGILPSDIKGAYPKGKVSPENFILNPNYTE